MKVTSAQLAKLREMTRSYASEPPGQVANALYRKGLVARLEFTGHYVVSAAGYNALASAG